MEEAKGRGGGWERNGKGRKNSEPWKIRKTWEKLENPPKKQLETLQLGALESLLDDVNAMLVLRHLLHDVSTSPNGVSHLGFIQYLGEEDIVKVYLG